MRVFRPFTFALGAVLASVSAAAEPLLADWAPCGSTNRLSSFECSVATLPLCHKGVCDSDKTVDVQVKRVAGVENASKAVWILTAGADASSSDVEGSLNVLARELDGQVDVYTMDVRGTGNSTLLGCKATDKYTTGAAVDFRVVADCAKSLYFQMDEQPASYSVTSAAKDVVSLIGEHKGDVFVYGSGIGSYLAARVMHMAPENVKGYVLDRVVSEKRGNFAYAGSNRLQAAMELAAMCDKSPDCRKNYGSGNLSIKDIWYNLANMYDEAKNDPKYAECTKLLCGECKDVSPSDMIRKLVEIGIPVSSKYPREEIPDVMETLWNCDDVAALRKRLETSEGSSLAKALREFRAEQETATADPLKEGPAEFFTQLIKHSEIWASPSRSWEEAKESIQSITFGADQTYDYAWHCVLSGKMDDPSCSALKEYGEQLSEPIDFSTIKNMQPLLYPHDDYYNKFATIPDGTSALLMTSKLDFDMPASWAKEQFDNMKGGDSIQLIEFETNAHGSEFIVTTPEDYNDCGAKIVASYVVGGGDLDKIDMSCFDELEPVDFKDMQS